jgi:hypothetical protein
MKSLFKELESLQTPTFHSINNAQRRKPYTTDIEILVYYVKG